MNYTNNPISVPVGYTDHNTDKKKVSFHQVIVTVTATCSGCSVTQEFSSPCPNTGSGNISFDIHTALMAAAENYPWSPTSLTAPSVSYSYETKEEYLLDGEFHTTAGSSSTGTATVGCLSDRERLAAVTTKTTCKPTSDSLQVAALNEIVVIGGKEYDTSATGEAGAKGFVYRLSETLAELPDRYVFRFVNHYGCVESISVETFRETEMNVSKSEYTISRPETINSFVRARYAKQNDYERWKFSSGPLTRAWQQWWAHEFLMAEYVWMSVNGSWLRVHILPEETVTLVNRTDSSILEVQFTVRFDINGDPTGLI